MASVKFRMKRSGTFQAYWTSTQNVCGTDPSLRPVYTFICEIETPTQLDVQGFILDNMLIAKYFTDTYAMKPVEPASCEKIAMRAVNDIVGMIAEHGISPYRVAVTIGGSALAELTYEWVNDLKLNGQPVDLSPLKFTQQIGRVTRAKTKYKVLVFVSDTQKWEDSVNDGLHERTFNSKTAAEAAKDKYGSYGMDYKAVEVYEKES